MGPLAVRVFHSPLAFVSGCLVWIPVTLWIVSLVHWMIQGDVDFVWGMVGIFLSFVLGILTMTPPRPEMAPYMLLGVVLTTVLFPIFRSSLNRRALDSVDIEAIEDAYEMLRLKPDNHIVRFKFAKLLYKRGLHASALKFAEQAMGSMPASAFFEEHRMVEGWKRSLKSRGPMETTIVCLECGTANELGVFVCARCRSEFLIDHVRGRWVGRNMARKLLAVWAAVMLVLIGIPMAAMLLDRMTSAGVIIFLMVAAVGIVVMGFFPPRGRSA